MQPLSATRPPGVKTIFRCLAAVVVLAFGFASAPALADPVLRYEWSLKFTSTGVTRSSNSAPYTLNIVADAWTEGNANSLERLYNLTGNVGSGDARNLVTWANIDSLYPLSGNRGRVVIGGGTIFYDNNFTANAPFVDNYGLLFSDALGDYFNLYYYGSTSTNKRWYVGAVYANGDTALFDGNLEAVAHVPEPASPALVMIALLPLALLRRRVSKKSA